MAKLFISYSQMMEVRLLTLRTYTLSGPTGAWPQLGQLVGRVVCSTVLSLRRKKKSLMANILTLFSHYIQSRNKSG